MAEMVLSALSQEGVSRVVSYVWGKREEAASQGHLKERLEMAVNDLELALERLTKLPITEVSQLQFRKKIKSAYEKATELLEKHEGHSVQGQKELGQGVKRKRWVVFHAKSKSLKTEDVRGFERWADYAGKLVRKVSGYSLSDPRFCNPLVRYLLEGKTLAHRMVRGRSRQQELILIVWAKRSEERGVEAALLCGYYDDTVVEKSFDMSMLIRLSESTDLAGVTIKCLQALLPSRFKLAAESAVGKLTQLANSQDISHVYAIPCAFQEEYIEIRHRHRPDPACCKARRLGLCADGNSVSSELSHMFPEEVAFFGFRCRVSALEYSNLRSSSNEAGTSVRRYRSPPLELEVSISPHYEDWVLRLFQMLDKFVTDKLGFDAMCVKNYYEDGTLPQAAEVIFSSAISHFLDKPESTEYQKKWLTSTHGAVSLVVRKPSTERAGAVKTRRYNTRASTKRIGR